MSDLSRAVAQARHIGIYGRHRYGVLPLAAGDAGGPLFIRQGNSPNMRDNQIIGAMLLDGLCGASGSGHVSVDVCIDIGVDYGCTISVNGKTVLSP